MKYFFILFFISFSVFLKVILHTMVKKYPQQFKQLSNIDFNNTSLQTKLEEKLYLLVQRKGVGLK